MTLSGRSRPPRAVRAEVARSVSAIMAEHDASDAPAPCCATLAITLESSEASPRAAAPWGSSFVIASRSTSCPRSTPSLKSTAVVVSWAGKDDRVGMVCK